MPGHLPAVGFFTRLSKREAENPPELSFLPCVCQIWVSRSFPPVYPAGRCLRQRRQAHQSCWQLKINLKCQDTLKLAEVSRGRWGSVSSLLAFCPHQQSERECLVQVSWFCIVLPSTLAPQRVAPRPGRADHMELPCERRPAQTSCTGICILTALQAVGVCVTVWRSFAWRLNLSAKRGYQVNAILRPQHPLCSSLGRRNAEEAPPRVDASDCGGP